jgi:hypothetical protein
LGKEEVQSKKLKDHPARSSEEKAEALTGQKLVGAFCFFDTALPVVMLPALN